MDEQRVSLGRHTVIISNVLLTVDERFLYFVFSKPLKRNNGKGFELFQQMKSYTKTAITNLAGINACIGHEMLEEQTRIHLLFISTLNTARKRKKQCIMHLYFVHPFCLSADEDMTIRLPRGLP